MLTRGSVNISDSLVACHHSLRSSVIYHVHALLAGSFGFETLVAVLSFGYGLWDMIHDVKTLYSGTLSNLVEIDIELFIRWLLVAK